MTTPIYRLDAVRHGYAGRVVLAIPHFSIHPGEMLALVGPSGAGKSTLLRLLQFLETPDTGTIAYAGQAIAGEPPLAVRRAITTVFQRPALLSGTVLHNVAYGLRLRGERTARAAATAALDALGLAPLASKPAHTLSGGEIQRLALARAMVLRPAVLLLDEPTANLDPANVQVIEQAVVALHREHATTIVLVTHNLFQARRLATRTAVLLDGQIIESGSTADLFTSPADQRTRAFLNGEMVY